MALATVLAASPLVESCVGLDAREPRENVNIIRISCQDSRTSPPARSVVAGIPVQVQGRCNWEGVEEVEFTVPCGRADDAVGCTLTLRVPGQASLNPGITGAPLEVRVSEAGMRGSFSALVELSRETEK